MYGYCARKIDFLKSWISRAVRYGTDEIHFALLLSPGGHTGGADRIGRPVEPDGYFAERAFYSRTDLSGA